MLSLQISLLILGKWHQIFNIQYYISNQNSKFYLFLEIFTNEHFVISSVIFKSFLCSVSTKLYRFIKGKNFLKLNNFYIKTSEKTSKDELDDKNVLNLFFTLLFADFAHKIFQIASC